MATAKNMKQLNNMLMKELRKASHVVSEKMLGDMYEETGGFYTSKEPKVYERTGALGDTPRTTAITSTTTDSGGEVSFKAYLDKDHQYTTGIRPSMATVLKHANTGGDRSNPPMRAVVGKSGFWERAEEKMEKSLNDTMDKYFG